MVWEGIELLKRFIVLVILALAACQSGGAVRQIANGEELANYNFSDANTFEQGAYGAATLRVSAGVYSIEVFEGDNTMWWGQWGDTYDDIIIEADVEQTSERTENAYGVMCRVRGRVGQPMTPDPELAAIAESTPEATSEATDEPTAEATAEAAAEATESAEATAEVTESAEATNEPTAEVTAEATESAEATDEPTAEATAEVTESAEATDEPTADPEAVIALEGDGYLFLIQGTGSFAIMRARGRDVVPLVDWRASDTIIAGPGRNRIRAVCVGNYLAMYVNGEFMGDATDDSYTSGQIGLAASAANRLGVRVEFDNVSVYAPASN
jgi:hypothetical protein